MADFPAERPTVDFKPTVNIQSSSIGFFHALVELSSISLV
jgi:hypothetical protein